MDFLRSVFSRSPEPDLSFAAEGYMLAALARLHAPNVDLHDLELKNALRLRAEGCSVEQALSARWGGVHAITSNLMDYDAAVATLNQAEAEGGVPNVASRVAANARFRSAAAMVMTLFHTTYPKEYGRFRRHIGA